MSVSVGAVVIMDRVSFFAHQIQHTNRTQNRLKQLVYLPRAFVVHHAIATALKNRTEADIEGHRDDQGKR